MEKRGETTLPAQCLCSSCPRYSECVTLSKRIFKTAQESTRKKLIGIDEILKRRNVEPQLRQELLQEVESELKKIDPFTATCGLLGGFLGLMFAEWVRKNYKPRRQRRR